MKSTGQMAFATFLLTFLGSVARLGTVLVESDDFMFKLQYIVGFILNLMIIIQFALYWSSSKKVDDKKKDDKKKK
jgi:prolipoprotein diacylglyceryltransferase